MTGDEYMRVLLARQAEWVVANGASAFPPLLTWFVRPDDVVDVPKPERAPERRTAPRNYKSAAELTAQRDRLRAELAAIFPDPGDYDPATVNISPNSSKPANAKRGRARFATQDRQLARYTTVTNQIQELDGRIARAQRRETS